MAHDLYNNIKVTVITAPISPSATGTISGTVVDTSGYRSNTFIVSAGAQTTTGITVTPVVMSGAATGTLTSAAASELLGTEAAAALSGTAGAGASTKVGYIGTSRYISCNTIVTGAATGTYSVQLIQSDPVKAPQ